MRKISVLIILSFLLIITNATTMSYSKELVIQKDSVTKDYINPPFVNIITQDNLYFDVQIRETDGTWHDDNLTAYQGSILEFKIYIETTRGYQLLTAALSLPTTELGPMFDYIENSEQCSKRTTMFDASDEYILFLWIPSLLPATITCTFRVKLQNLGIEKEVLGAGIGVIDNETSDVMNDTLFITGEPSPAPDIPNTPNGPNSGLPGNVYTYTTRTIDPNGDLVYYKWDWGDQITSDWEGPYPSGDTINSSHVWETRGYYSIKVKARDEEWHESGWSDLLPVEIPKSKVCFSHFLIPIFENSLYLFPTFRAIL
jgi:hypothetical protein